MFGLKIYDEEKKFESLKTILNFLNNNRDIPLEIGSYHKKDYINDYIRENTSNLKTINGHCSGKSNILKLANDKTVLNYIEDELKLFKTFNSSYSVIHIANEWMPNREEIIIPYIDYVLPSIEEINKLAVNNDYSFYIENTGGDLNFYYLLYNEIINKELKNIHFCFDVGHALLGTNHSLENWKEFIRFIVSNNKKIHFHIHTNNVFEDEHKIPDLTMKYNHNIYSSYTHNYPADILDLEFEGRKIIEANPNLYTGEEIIEKIGLLNKI